MTRAQFRKKVRELHENKELFNACIQNFLESECVNLSNYEDNYILPKMFMYAFAEEMKFQWKPLNKKDVKKANIIARII